MQPVRPLAARRVAAATLVALVALATAPAHADPYGRHRGGHHHHHRGWNGWVPLVGAVVLGAAAAQIAAAQTPPQTIVLPPAPPPPLPVAVVPVVPAPPALPVPVAPAPHAGAVTEWIIYPRHGQPPAQLEADRLACQQWAVTVPGAWGHPAVLRRAEAACLDGRGYTVR
jgi:hypothetical protein